MVNVFPLKFQGINQKNALAMDSAKGKFGERGRIFTVLWRWNNHIYDRAPKIIFSAYCEDKTINPMIEPNEKTGAF